MSVAGLAPPGKGKEQATDVTALMRGDTALAQSGPAMDWPDIATALQEQGERFVIAPKDGGALIWGAAAAVPHDERR